MCYEHIFDEYMVSELFGMKLTSIDETESRVR